MIILCLSVTRVVWSQRLVTKDVNIPFITLKAI